MERRREPRVNTDQPVRVTVLNGQQTTLQGTVINLSGKGMRLAVPEEIAPGALLRLDLSDSILLAEVSHCCTCDGEIQVGAQIEHVLTNLGELARLRDNLKQESDMANRVSARVW